MDARKGQPEKELREGGGRLPDDPFKEGRRQDRTVQSAGNLPEGEGACPTIPSWMEEREEVRKESSESGRFAPRCFGDEAAGILPRAERELNKGCRESRTFQPV